MGESIYEIFPVIAKTTSWPYLTDIASPISQSKSLTPPAKTRAGAVKPRTISSSCALAPKISYRMIDGWLVK